jgi:hypothetical protein
MPGPVVNGVKVGRSASGEAASQVAEALPFLPVLSEGTIRVVLLTSGHLVVARLRQTTDPDGDRAYQLIPPPAPGSGTSMGMNGLCIHFWRG